MNRTNVPWYRTTEGSFPICRRLVAFLFLLAWSSALALAQDAANAASPGTASNPVSVRATHLLGFEGSTSNATGTLSIQDDALQFKKAEGPAALVKIANIQDVFLGERDVQVGGVPMTLGKAAAPFGGGRVVSLFAHKKYDTFTLQYVDQNGGVHGAIFQVNKGQGEILRNGLIARGAHLGHGEQPASGGTSDSK